jgi:hypothetical protein
VSGEGYASVISDALAPAEKKAEPALYQPWFQAQAEMMSLVGKMTQRMASASGSGSEALRFSGADLKGRFISISPDTIHLVTEPGAAGGQAVVLRVDVSAAADRAPRSFWVKALTDPGTAQSQAQPDVESLLKNALAEVQSPASTETRAEDGAEVVHLYRTSMAFAGSESAARGASLGAP